MTLDKLYKSVALLELHNEWRRDGNIDFANPKAVGVAIDDAIEAMRELIEIKSHRKTEPL